MSTSWPHQLPVVSPTRELSAIAPIDFAIVYFVFLYSIFLYLYRFKYTSASSMGLIVLSLRNNKCVFCKCEFVFVYMYIYCASRCMSAGSNGLHWIGVSVLQSELVNWYVFVLVHSAHFYACKCKRKSVYPTDWIEPVCLRNYNCCVCTAIRNGTPIVCWKVAIGIGELVRLLPLLPELFARGADQNWQRETGDVVMRMFEIY